jgi:hypothetical protein
MNRDIKTWIYACEGIIMGMLLFSGILAILV